MRQTDPLSSFLFNIVSESLNFLIKKACSKVLIAGLRTGDDEVKFTHEQYADDTLPFLPKDEVVVCNYRRLL